MAALDTEKYTEALSTATQFAKDFPLPLKAKLTLVHGSRCFQEMLQGPDESLMEQVTTCFLPSVGTAEWTLEDPTLGSLLSTACDYYRSCQAEIAGSMDAGKEEEKKHEQMLAEATAGCGNCLQDGVAAIVVRVDAKVVSVSSS